MKSVCPFKVPDEGSRKGACGALAGAPFKIKKAMQVLIPRGEPIHKPKESDWLWEHDEDG